MANNPRPAQHKDSTHPTMEGHYTKNLVAVHGTRPDHDAKRASDAYSSKSDASLSHTKAK